MREQIYVNAPPEVVWPFVADPMRMLAWQPKVSSVTPITAGEARAGARYRIVFRRSKGEQPFNTTIEVFQPPARVVLVHEGQSDRRVRETFDLLPAEHGYTRLLHRLDLRDAGSPWYLRPLVAFIERFGQPQGEGPLHRLKGKVESSMSPPVQTR